MSEVQRLVYEDGNEQFEIYIESRAVPTLPPEPKQDDDLEEGYGWQEDTAVKMRQARDMIRGYTLYALSAFKNFGAAEIQEVNLKFGLKIGGKAGIPYITEGTTESNLEISVKCTFPDPEKADLATEPKV
ncbi:MAG TPA: CU044_2847 family protein [Candidatus Obscuribacterales bacterium]